MPIILKIYIFVIGVIDFRVTKMFFLIIIRIQIKLKREDSRIWDETVEYQRIANSYYRVTSYFSFLKLSLKCTMSMCHLVG